MNCWHCQLVAVGTCRFCGRALCENHVQTKPFVMTLDRTKEGISRVLVVEDALYCGVCRPRPDPVELPELDA
jgi:hypothetical protein